MASWLMRMGSFMVLNMPLAYSGDKPVRNTPITRSQMALPHTILRGARGLALRRFARC